MYDYPSIKSREIINYDVKSEGEKIGEIPVNKMIKCHICISIEYSCNYELPINVRSYSTNRNSVCKEQRNVKRYYLQLLCYCIRNDILA